MAREGMSCARSPLLLDPNPGPTARVAFLQPWPLPLLGGVASTARPFAAGVEVGAQQGQYPLKTQLLLICVGSHLDSLKQGHPVQWS